MCICHGMQCGFWSGDPTKLIEDLQILKPTFFATVPRILNRVYSKLVDGISKLTGFKKWLIDHALATKIANFRNGKGVKHPFYDPLVFAKFKALLGGRVKRMISASALISAEVLEFLQVAFCCPLAEAYGMTESSGASVATYARDSIGGHVGGPAQNVKIRLKDYPDLNYLTSSSPPQGEICFWGSGITEGYFMNPELTETVMQDGWLQTGDIGEIDARGTVRIIDRIKSIFSISTGERIAPEMLENVYV
mmetsp:Transcript_19062/g.29248  ORF Transcript_19062/g.29248 Transcript_19062/m.29248 type:complete len:250 (-) Transcript_19062:64-813(-)